MLLRITYELLRMRGCQILMMGCVARPFRVVSKFSVNNWPMMDVLRKISEWSETFWLNDF